ncbi:MAG: hypothetical protein ACYC9L_02935 [Sulfuricaulis sp.]
MSMLMIASALVAGTAFAQVPSQNVQNMAPVAVTGAANAEQIRYSDLLAGVDAFKKYRHYAPAATLAFFLKDKKAAVTPASLMLRTDEKDFPVPVAADGKFDLPTPAQIGGKDGFLVANRKAGMTGVVPTVRSAADTDTSIRLGDLRLQCEVSWAIEKQNAPKAVRAMFFLGGRVCHSSKIAVNYFQGEHALASATLSEKGAQLPLKILSDGVTYWVPLGDTKWSDEATVTLSYADRSAPKAAP